MLTRAGLPRFKPHTFASELVQATVCAQTAANAAAWAEGMHRLDVAVAQRQDFALETTLGGRSVPARLRAASRTHDVLVWFCGLDSPERHLERVRERVAAGGHDMAEAKIRERWRSAIANLITLLPELAQVCVFDNGAGVAPDEIVPDPVPVAISRDSHLHWPVATDAAQLARTPDWAKPLLEAGLVL